MRFLVRDGDLTDLAMAIIAFAAEGICILLLVGAPLPPTEPVLPAHAGPPQSPSATPPALGDDGGPA